MKPSASTGRVNRKLARALAIGTYVAGAIGCANVIGLSDIENKDPPKDDVIIRAGSSGSGGMAGKGGGGGTAGNGGTGGGGTAGNGGSSGGGTAGTGTGMDACDGTPIDVNETLLRGCVMLESCSSPQRGISYCLSFDAPETFTAFACAGNATSCDDIAQCQQGAYLYPDAPVSCPGTVPDTACQGNYAVNCDPDVFAPIPIFYDCTLRGGTCALQSDGFPDCAVDVVHDCANPLVNDGDSFCDGNFYYYCWDGLPYGQDCAASAAYCDVDPTSLAANCYYALPSCSGETGTCDTDVGVQCSGGSRFQFNCDEAGIGCETLGTDVYCLASGCTTTQWNNCQETCNGSELTFCYGGSPVTIDCQDYGFDTCRMDDVNYSGRTSLAVAVCGYEY